MHQVERIVDLVEQHHVRDQRVDLDLAVHVPVDDLWHVAAATRAAGEQQAFARLYLGLIDQLRRDGLISLNGATALKPWATMRSLLLKLLRTVTRFD